MAWRFSSTFLLFLVVIILEGGAPEDLKVLDEAPKAINGSSNPGNFLDSYNDNHHLCSLC